MLIWTERATLFSTLAVLWTNACRSCGKRPLSRSPSRSQCAVADSEVSAIPSHAVLMSREQLTPALGALPRSGHRADPSSFLPSGVAPTITPSMHSAASSISGLYG